MEIREKLTADMKTAMREKDSLKLDTIRFLQSAIKNREIELRPAPISAEEVMGVIRKLVKQRKESIDQYKSGGRMDLADKEAAELKILETYLPSQMSKADVEKLVEKVISETQAKTIKDMGQVMKLAVAQSQGSADNKMLSEIIKAKLQG